MEPQEWEPAARPRDFNSDDEMLPQPKRQKRHKFKTFAERVKNVDVDVYHSFAPKRVEPLPGASCFFEERLAAWRELNAAHDWLEAAAALHPLSQSLPQLLHHQTDILDIILQRVRPDAGLSLEPFMDLLAALARDLQADFLPHMDRVLATLSDFVDQGGDREPELLEHVFTCASSLCKHLCRLLVPDLVPVLYSSARLRYHKARHVRQMAAQSFGYLLRHAPPGPGRVAVRTVLADAATKPSVARIHGAAALIAEAVAGAGHGLHSRAPATLGLLLQRDILTPADFQTKGGKGKKAGKSALESAEQLEARVAAVAEEALQQVLNHVRRGPAVLPLWETVSAEVESRIDALESVLKQRTSDGNGAPSANGKSSSKKAAGGKRSRAAAGSDAIEHDTAMQSAKWGAARAVALLSSMLEYHRGSRVESYKPFFALAQRFAGPELCNSDHASKHSHATDVDMDALEEDDEEAAPFVKFAEPSLSAQVLRFLQALVYSHTKVVGASEGPAAIENVAPLWAGVFARAPAGEILRFVRALVALRGGVDATRCFVSQMLAAVGRCLLQGQYVDLCWPLLMDICSVYGGSLGGAMPIILTASSGLGPQLGQLVISTVGVPQGASEQQLHAAWAAVHCLPHAVPTQEQATESLQGVLNATRAGSSSSKGSASMAAFVLHCSARVALAKLAAPDLSSLEEALTFLEQQPREYHAVHAAAELLAHSQTAALPATLAPSHFARLAGLLAPNLGSKSAALRRQTLRLLCAFPQPSSQASGGTEDVDAGQACDALQQLLGIEERPLGADSGRAAVVALGRLKNYFEYGRIPDVLVPAVVSGLLGTLHIRFSSLWSPAASSLAAALDAHPAVTWPLLLEALTAAQAAFLRGEVQVQSHSLPGAVEDEEHKEVTLRERFAATVAEGSAEASGGSTDAAVRLTHLLKALSGANNNVVEGKAKDWIPLFLTYSAAKTPEGVGGTEEAEEVEDDAGGGEEESENEEEIVATPEHAVSSVPTRIWRSGLKEWLALMAGLKGLRAVPNADAVRHSVATHLMDSDPAVQQAVLKCLKAFKMSWLAPYVDRLLRLADNKTLRAELAAFPLALKPTSLREGDEEIQPEHRQALLPVVMALLFPKMRKRSGRLGGKGAPGSARAAILNFLSAAEPQELRPILELFLGPLGQTFTAAQDSQDVISPAKAQRAEHDLGIAGVYWWGRCLGERQGAFWLDAIDAQALNSQPVRRRIGYLNTLEDLLQHLGHKMERYLPELLALTAVLLQGAVDSEGEEGAKEVRSRCLRLAAAVLERFSGAIDYNFLWDPLFTASAPLMDRIATEASADKAPPVVQLCAALASAPQLVPVLADGQSLVGTSAPDAAVPVVASSQPWAAEHHLGSRLLSRCVAALSASTCAEPTRTTMLDALESIFDLQDPLPEQVLGAHTPDLLAGLQAIVVAVWKQGSGGDQHSRKKLPGASGAGGRPSGPPRRATATRALAILELVGGRTSDWGTAAQLTDALLPLVQPQGGSKGRKRADEELIARALDALTALWSRLAALSSPEQVALQRDRLEHIAAAVAPLAGSLASREARHALCAAFSTTASLLPEELAGADALLTGLNAMSTTEIDEPDYERRMGAYGQLTPERWGSFSLLAAAPLLQHCVRDLRNAEDLSLRHAAAQALEHLIAAAASAVDSSASAAEQAPVVLLVQRHLFAQLKRSVGHSNLAVRQEHLALVRRLALALPGVFGDLAPLTNANEDLDFWLSVSHLQLHRRARALGRLARMLQENTTTSEIPPLTLGVTMGFVLPVLQQAIVEGRASDDSAHEAKQLDIDRTANVVDAAVGALGAVGSILPWTQYQQLLGQYLRLMARHADTPAAKPVLRAVCALLDAFHFLAADQGDKLDAAAANMEGDVDEIMSDEDEDAVPEAPTSAEAPSAVLPAREEVFRMLVRRVVPELRDQLVAKGKVRAPVARALVKVLKLLPEELMRLELPRTLQLVANLLKNRIQSARDDARVVLVDMATELGPEYLPFVIEVMRSALPDYGFTAHVLGYTMHAVLEGVAPEAANMPGSIDDCLPMIIPILESDLFGDVADAKEVSAFAASYKEAKRCRANDTYKLLASLVTFSTHLPQLLAPVRLRLAEASHPKTRAKLSALLQHASRGVLLNPTATPQDICELVFAVASSGLAAEEAARDVARGASGAAERKDGREPAAAPDAGRSALHQHVLVEFVLSVLYSSLKKGLVPMKGEENAARLDPLLPLLVRALRSRHTPSVTSALQCLTLLLQADLPSLGKASTDAGKAVTDLLKRCPKTTHPIAQDCFKLLAGMLRRCEHYSPSQSQLRFLLGWAFADLEESAERQSAFVLLRAILARKLVLPEVYDLMNRVQELVVRSQATQVRQLAAATLLQFLLDYPLGADRLRQHLQFLLTNLAYEHESGREAALDMLSTVLNKFPAQLITDWAEMMFLPLVTRLVNDQSSKCRTAVAACVATLLRRVTPSRRDRLVAYCLEWIRGTEPRLVRASAQTLGILVDVEGSGVGRRMPEVMGKVAAVLQHCVQLDESATEDDDGKGSNGAALSEEAAPGWQEAYYSTVLLEKAMAAVPAQLAWGACDASPACWTATKHLLLHRHLWVRKAAGRLLGAGLADSGVGPAMLTSGRDATAPGALALGFLRQMDSPSADEALAAQAVKCLVFLTEPMYQADAASGRVPGSSWSCAQNGKKGADDSAVVGDEANADEEEERAEDDAAAEAAAGCLSLQGLVRRMVRLADDKSFVRQAHRATALRFIAAMASRLGPVKVKPYLPVLLRPLYRITEPGATGNSEEVKTLADEIVGHLRSLVGADSLLAAYNAAREAVRAQRGERKQRAAVQALVDPEAAAKRKLRVAERKAAGKKRALEEVRRMRSAGVVVKNKGAGGRRGQRQ